MSELEITVGHPGEEHVTLDGVDVGRFISEILIEVKAGQQTRLILTVLPGDHFLASANLKDVEVRLKSGHE